MNYLAKNVTILFPLLIIYTVLLFVFWVTGLGTVGNQQNVVSNTSDLAILHP